MREPWVGERLNIISLMFLLPPDGTGYYCNIRCKARRSAVTNHCCRDETKLPRLSCGLESIVGCAFIIDSQSSCVNDWLSLMMLRQGTLG